MAKGWNRLEVWLTLAVAAVAGVLLLVGGLHFYITSTATPLHPDAGGVPSVAGAAPGARWAGAVERGRQVMRSGLIEQNLPGVSVAVGVGDGIVWTEGFGWADLEDRIPVAPDTRFRIGTASIALTSAAIGLLLEQGSLKLDEPIQTYVPEFPKKPWPVTLRHVLGHTAGIRNDGGDEGPLFSERCERPVEALPHFADRDLLFEPGTSYRYSSFGWIVASAAVEHAAQQPFLRFMRDRVFEPLGMNDTRPDTGTEDPTPGRATPYFPRYGADPRYGPDLMRDLEYSCYAGASVFLSTPSDLVRYGLAIHRGTLLKRETVDLLMTPQRLRDGKETGYALGWDLETVTLGGRPTQVVGHDGNVLGGMAASLLLWRERGVVVAIVSNTSYADTAALAVKIADAFGAAPPAS